MRLAVARQALPEHNEGNGHHHNPQEECQHLSPQLPSLARAITPQRSAYNHQSHGQYRDDVEQNVPRPGHRKEFHIVVTRTANTMVPGPSPTPGRFCALLGNADEPLRGAQEIGTRAPRGSGPMPSSAIGALCRKSCATFRVPTTSARFRAYSDHVCRSALAGLWVPPAVRLAEPLLSAPTPCPIAVGKSGATSPASSTRELRRPAWQNRRVMDWVGSGKARQRGRKAASIFM